MGREIKFRWFGKENKKMWYFSFADIISHGHNMYPEILENIEEGDEKTDQDTLMQFTGLYDKQGKEIWESDIVRVLFDSSSFVATVEWGSYDDSEYVTNVECWMYKPLKGSKASGWPISDGGGMYSVGKHTLEVVGNIWENPTLLDKGNIN